MSDNDDGVALETSDAADNGFVFAEQAVARQQFEVGNQSVDIVQTMRTVGVARDLGFLPRGQFGIQLFRLFFDFFLQARNFFGDIDAVFRRRQSAQAFNLAFQFGNRFFKFQILFLFHGKLRQKSNFVFFYHFWSLERIKILKFTDFL